MRRTGHTCNFSAQLSEKSSLVPYTGWSRRLFCEHTFLLMPNICSGQLLRSPRYRNHRLSVWHTSTPLLWHKYMGSTGSELWFVLLLHTSAPQQKGSTALSVRPRQLAKPQHPPEHTGLGWDSTQPRAPHAHHSSVVHPSDTCLQTSLSSSAVHFPKGSHAAVQRASSFEYNYTPNSPRQPYLDHMPSLCHGKISLGTVGLAAAATLSHRNSAVSQGPPG